MKVTQITNTNFTANPIKIAAADNKQLPHLYMDVMKATGATGEHRSGQIIYHMGENARIEIANPAETLPAYLAQLGVKFTTLSEQS